ncbi:hypothetical protein ACIG3E_33040 [Streptomyces sp. NPDC053474]
MPTDIRDEASIAFGSHVPEHIDTSCLALITVTLVIACLAIAIAMKR